MKNSFKEKLRINEFVNTVEVIPPKGFRIDNIIEKLKKLKKIEIFNVVDSPLSDPRMHPIALCHKIETTLGKETIMHFTCRDRNKIEIEADLLAAYSLGVRNVLALTGDPCKNGKGVFEFSSLGLIKFIYKLNKKHGMDYFVGCGMNINARSLENEVAKTQKKIDKGAKFVITQPCLNFERIEKVKENIDIPIILGFIFSFKKKTIQFLKDNVPGVDVPDELIEISDDKQKIVDYYKKTIQKVKKIGLNGLCFVLTDEYEILERLI